MKIFLKIRHYKCCITIEMVSVSIRDITIIVVKNDDLCIIQNISESEAINLLTKSVLEDRRYT